jgi:hypothetical protein
LQQSISEIATSMLRRGFSATASRTKTHECGGTFRAF